MIRRVKTEDFARGLLDTLDEGLFQTVYRMGSVDVDDVLRKIRNAGVEVDGLDDLGSVPTEELDPIVNGYIRRARFAAAASGISFGFGGWLSLPPGLAHLVVVCLRLAQRTSLVYGFDHRTDRGEIELWKALAAATGANVDWEGTEAELMRRLPAVVTGTGTFSNPLLLKAFQAVVVRVALAAGLRATRWVPMVGSGSGLVLNYLQVDRIGRQLKQNWRARHVIDRFDRSAAVEVEILG
jgi:hypothetical protein